MVQTKGLWLYEMRTKKHFTSNTRTLELDDPQAFIGRYHLQNRHEWKDTCPRSAIPARLWL